MSLLPDHMERDVFDTSERAFPHENTDPDRCIVIRGIVFDRDHGDPDRGGRHGGFPISSPWPPKDAA
jgi:hypothetical protein